MNSRESSAALAVIPAGGAGLRMGGGASKLLRPLCGEPLIFHTVSALVESKAFRKIVLVCRSSERCAFQEVLRSFGSALLYADGGASRQDSVRNGLKAFSEADLGSAEEIVVIHDGARCLASPGLFTRVIDAARKYGAVTTALPVVDSLKIVNSSGEVEESLDRSSIWGIQTPQAFRFELLWEAHHSGATGATDDACLVEASHKVKVIEGERYNIKITTPEDYRLAEILLQG